MVHKPNFHSNSKSYPSPLSWNLTKILLKLCPYKRFTQWNLCKIKLQSHTWLRNEMNWFEIGTRCNSKEEIQIISFLSVWLMFRFNHWNKSLILHQLMITRMLVWNTNSIWWMYLMRRFKRIWTSRWMMQEAQYDLELHLLFQDDRSHQLQLESKLLWSLIL